MTNKEELMNEYFKKLLQMYEDCELTSCNRDCNCDKIEVLIIEYKNKLGDIK